MVNLAQTEKSMAAANAFNFTVDTLVAGRDLSKQGVTTPDSKVVDSPFGKIDLGGLSANITFSGDKDKGRGVS